jgi:hypothetical protein
MEAVSIRMVKVTHANLNLINTSRKEVKLMKVKSRVKAGNGGRFEPGG